MSNIKINLNVEMFRSTVVQHLNMYTGILLRFVFITGFLFINSQCILCFKTQWNFDVSIYNNKLFHTFTIHPLDSDNQDNWELLLLFIFVISESKLFECLQFLNNNWTKIIFISLTEKIVSLSSFISSVLLTYNLWKCNWCL